MVAGEPRRAALPAGSRSSSGDAHAGDRATTRRARRSAATSATASSRCCATRRRTSSCGCCAAARSEAVVEPRRAWRLTRCDRRRARRGAYDEVAGSRRRPPAGGSRRVPGRSPARARRRPPPGRRSRSAASRSPSSTPRWRSRRAAAARSRAARPPVPAALRPPGGAAWVQSSRSSRTGRPMLAKPGRGRLAAGGARAHRGREGARSSSPSQARRPARRRSCRSSPATPARASPRSARATTSTPEHGCAAACGRARRRVGRARVPRSIERSLAVGAGLAPPDRAPGRSGMPGGRSTPRSSRGSAATGSPTSDWPAFLRLAAEMERIAFGPPPVNAAKLLALVDAGRVDLDARRGGRSARAADDACVERGERAVDVVVDAVLPRPGRRAPWPPTRSSRMATRASPRPPRARCRRRRHLPGAGRRARPRPGGDRPADRGLRDRQRHAQPHAPSAAPTAGRARVVERWRPRRRRAARAELAPHERRGLRGRRAADGAPRALAGGALRAARAARRVDRALRLAAQRPRPGAARAQRGASSRHAAAASASTSGSSSPARPTRRSPSSTRRGGSGSASTSPSERELRQVLERGVPAATSS